VLLAEDNPINRRVTAAMLEHLGFEVDIVAHGADAVKAATLTRYRAIFMDCQIPGLDGYEATAEIRRREGSTGHTPVIAVTSSRMHSEQGHFLAAGMDDYLAKPVSLKALSDMLARWCPPPVADIVETDLADSTESVLDVRVVGRLERLGAAAGEDLVGQLAAMFISEATTRLNGLRDAIYRDDTPAITRSAHTLSGSSANLGAAELARLCAALATESIAADRARRTGLFGEIETALEKVRSALGLLVATP
jgi:two-component system, sensor histidine kinase and response regulator